MTAQRRALHAYLSEDAHEQWHAVAIEWGVSVSALLEALAPILADHHEGSEESEPAAEQAEPPDARSIVHTARQIDAQRRRRSQG